jgi:hypothetical protein
MMKATIVYNPNAQKTPGLFDRVLTPQVLQDICVRVTGQCNYKVIKDNSSYNKGRLVYIHYNGCINYITLSESVIGSRNASVQSVPTAINLFYTDTRVNKKLFYYFLPHEGNPFTDYHLFMYKIMMTAGIIFLNINDYYAENISPYTTIDDLIVERDENRGGNASNNSSYVSKTIDKIQIYAKVFGANKYESTLLAIAASQIADRPIDLFHICEQDLTKLPASSVTTLNSLGNINLIDTSLNLEKHKYIENHFRLDLRSPTYHYNLHRQLGRKKCALCGCEIPEIIQGAHIWGVAEIAASSDINDDKKFEHATSGNNGLWLCQNHHKLFDSNIILLNSEGSIMVADNIKPTNRAFIANITCANTISEFMSDNFKWYLSQRNQRRNFANYHSLAI